MGPIPDLLQMLPNMVPLLRRLLLSLPVMVNEQVAIAICRVVESGSFTFKNLSSLDFCVRDARIQGYSFATRHRELSRLRYHDRVIRDETFSFFQSCETLPCLQYFAGSYMEASSLCVPTSPRPLKGIDLYFYTKEKTVLNEAMNRLTFCKTLETLTLRNVKNLKATDGKFSGQFDALSMLSLQLADMASMLVSVTIL